MSFNTAMLRQMRDEGLDLDACIRIFEAGESERSTAAVRQQRYRDNKRNERDVTRNVTHPPKEDQTPLSVSDETVASDDPVKVLFDLGVSLLEAQGHDERKARSLIGKWRKGRSDGDVAAALLEARTKAISNLVEWMPRRLGNGSGQPQPFFKSLAGASP